MPALQAGLTVLHLAAGGYWLAGSVILALVLRPVWHKYREYVYFQNYGLEILRIFLTTFHISLAVSVISGAGLMGLSGRSPWEGLFGLVFSIKMILMLGLFFLLQPALRYPGGSADAWGEKQNIWQRYAIGGMALLVVSAAVLLRYL